MAADLGLADALALQSMYIFKQPGIGGEVGCHQDATFLYTDPMTVTGFWFAIEDATLENGCLWAAPGRSSRRPACARCSSASGDMTDDDGTVFEQLDPTPLPTPPDELVPLEVPAGTLVVLHGLLPHWSGANRSARSRHAYSVHCIAAAADYPEWNWLQRPARCRCAGSTPWPPVDPRLRWRRDRAHPASPQGAAARPPRRRRAAGHGRRAGRRSSATRACPRPTSTSLSTGSTAAPSATTSCSTSRRSPTRSA